MLPVTQSLNLMKISSIAACLLLTSAFFSCKQLKVSENETKAMEEIAGLYGGSCSYIINLTASTKHGKTKSFEMEISNSEFLNENTQWTEMFAANVAYVFYTFVKEEKEKYNSLKSSIVYQDGGKVSFNYSLDTLEIVDKKMAYVKRVVDILKTQDYERISKTIKPGFFLRRKTDIDQFMSHLKAADSAFGKIMDFTPAGFKFNYAANGNEFLHVSGNLKRSKLDTQFSIDINPMIGTDELYLYGYGY